MANEPNESTSGPSAKPNAPKAVEPSGKTVVATLHSFSVHRFQVRAGDDTYVITRGGTVVPAEHATTIQNAALNARLVVNVTAKD